MEKEQNMHSEEEKHTAMDKIAGFTFQFYYFIYKLLTIKHDETVSFEKLDDAAAESVSGAITLFQVKHTIQGAIISDVKKEPVLTNRSPDLWKAVDVWRKFIIARGSEEKQKEYIDNHKFIFICNKTTKGNKFISACDHSSTEAEIDKMLSDITSEAKPRKEDTISESGVKPSKKRNVQSMVNDLSSFKLRAKFLKNITFEYESFPCLEKKCIAHITGQIRFPKKDSQAVFDSFMIEVVKDFTKAASIGAPLEYMFDNQLKRFERVFEYYRSQPLDFKVEKHNFSTNFLELNCIKQLIMVNDVNSTQLEKIARYTSNFLSFKNRYNKLNADNRILQEEDEMFKDDAIEFYKNEFDYFYDDLDDVAGEDEINKISKELLRSIRNKQLSLRQEQLATPISNGAYYFLSDECLIGWHKHWKTHFKKE